VVHRLDRGLARRAEDVLKHSEASARRGLGTAVSMVDLLGRLSNPALKPVGASVKAESV
jgi:hypothetical protein